MSTLLILGLSCLVVSLAFAFLFWCIAKSAREADDMFHASFLKEVNEYKKKMEAENK